MTLESMHATNKVLVGLFLVPPWIAFLVAAYWLLLDTEAPIQIVYEHPKFLNAPAKTREEAAQLSVDTVKSGTSLYIYREICVRSRGLVGTVRAVWESGTFVWAAPERPVPEFRIGCAAENFNVVAPTTSPTRDFVYKASWWIEQNPLTTHRTDLNQILLRVLSPTDGASQTDMVRR